MQHSQRFRSAIPSPHPIEAMATDGSFTPLAVPPRCQGALRQKATRSYPFPARGECPLATVLLPDNPPFSPRKMHPIDLMRAASVPLSRNATASKTVNHNRKDLRPKRTVPAPTNPS
jgi:hypothetical protein